MAARGGRWSRLDRVAAPHRETARHPDGQTSAAAHPVTRQREPPQVMPVATLGQAAMGGGGSTPGRTGTPRRQGGRRTKSPTPDPELPTACVGSSVGNLDTSKEVG